MGAEFLNIELQVTASFGLEHLSQAFGDNFSLNYCGVTEPGNYLLSGALAYRDDSDRSPNSLAIGLCKLVEVLEPSARELWDAAADRIFDVGLNANFDRKVIVELFTPIHGSTLN